VALRPISTWFNLVHHEPGVPLAVLALYRPGGDIQYYPLISALSRLTLGDGVLLEHYRHGFSAFPIAALLPHALLYGALGTRGFVVADVVVALAYYLALAALLRVIGLSVGVARAASVLVATGAMEMAWNGAVAWQLFPAAARLTLWGERIPRTFTTEVVLLLALGALVAVTRAHPEAQEPRRWATLGAWFGVLLQSDFYASITVALSIATMTTLVAWQLRSDPRHLARCLASGAVAVFVVALPFVLQQALIHPDLPRRLGVVPVPRLSLPRAIEPELARLRVLVVAGVVALAIVPGLYRDHRARRLGLVVIGVVGTTLLTLVAWPISTLLMGRTVQPYHFGQFWLQLSSYTFVILALLIARGLFELARRRRATAVWRWLTGPAKGPLLGVAALLAGIHARGGAGRGDRSWEPAPYGRGAVRSDFGEYGRLPEYRAHFTDLVREISLDRYREARVLGTLDHQVYVYWTTFERRFVTVADPFASTASDGENELRLMSLLKLVGASGEEFQRTLEQHAVLVLFLGHSKYSDGNWNVKLPPAEAARLVSTYAQLEAAQTPFVQPDLIVLTTNETSRGLRPRPAAYEQTYQNTVFTVWKRL